MFTLAQTFLYKLYSLRIEEMGRMYVIFRQNAYMYLPPLYEFHIKMGDTDRRRGATLYKWDDASISIGYFDYVLRRIQKYGLHRGPLSSAKFPSYKEMIQEEEDKLVDYFLYEMRKPPLEEKELPRMPLR